MGAAGSFASVLLLLAGCSRTSTRDAAGRPVAAKVYALHCAGCHGDDGRRGKPEMHLTGAAQRSEAELRAIISGGREQVMPAFKDRLKPDELDALVGYVRALGASAAPAASP